jgi:hypothetical protein
MSFGLNQFGGDDNNSNTQGFGGNGVAGFGSGMSVDASSSSDLQHPIDPSTPWTAIAEGNLPLLQQSLQQLQYPIYVSDEIQGYTLLQAAASYNHMHILQYIWSELQKCNPSSDDGETTATTTAATTSTPPEGGYQNAVDFDGDTALHYAGSVEVMKFLIDTCHINMDITNQNQMTALDAKRTEMHDIEQDVDDFDEDDVEYTQLKEMVQYLESRTTNPQDIL